MFLLSSICPHNVKFTWAMTTGFVLVWRQIGESVRGFSWSGLTREICTSLWKNIAFITKGGNCPFSRSKHFSALPTHPVFHVACTRLPTLWLPCSPPAQENTALLQSFMGFWFGRCRCGEQSVPAVSNCTHGRWPHYEPFCFGPCQACCSRQLFSLSPARGIPLAPSTTHALTYNTTFSQTWKRFLATSTFFTAFAMWIAVCFSKLW